MSQDKVAGLVLAGGRSARMGQDKTQMLLDGLPLVERARQCLLASMVSEVWIAGTPGGGKADVRPGMGPAVATLDWLQSPFLKGYSHCVVIPVDMPLLTPELLDRLITLARHSSGACYLRHHFLPAVLPLNGAYFDRANTRFEQTGKLSMGNLLTLAQATIVDPDSNESAQLANINHPQDWQDLLASRTEPGRFR